MCYLNSLCRDFCGHRACVSLGMEESGRTLLGVSESEGVEGTV